MIRKRYVCWILAFFVFPFFAVAMSIPVSVKAEQESPEQAIEHVKRSQARHKQADTAIQLYLYGDPQEAIRALEALLITHQNALDEVRQHPNDVAVSTQALIADLGLTHGRLATKYEETGHSGIAIGHWHKAFDYLHQWRQSAFQTLDDTLRTQQINPTPETRDTKK